MQSADVTATWCATVVDEWCALGARDVVLAPGSRSTPMALALAAEARLRLHVFHDERSASFAALGMAMANGVPTLLLCTSGTAAVNFHAAVVEASHAEVPLIVLTADRPPELQGVGAPQTIDQQRLFGVAVRSFVDVGVPDDERRDEWRRSAQRAWSAATAQRPGPVHVNLPFREPLVGMPGDLPAREFESATRKVRALPTEQLSRLSIRLAGRRGVIVAGVGAPSTSALARLADALAWPVLAEPRSGARADHERFIRHADAFLRHEPTAKSLQPDVVVRFGAPHASKVIATWLRDSDAELVVVSESPFLIDPDRRCAMHVVAAPDAVCDDVAAVVAGRAATNDWLDEWAMAERTARAVIASMLDDEATLSEPGAARAMAASLPANASLVVSSSMPVRDLEWYAAATDHLRVLANRGANGIDGVVSTAVGVALATQAPTGLLIGDIAFLHDSNGLVALRHRVADLRIVVVDNDGGGIFSFLPQRSTLEHERFEQLFGTPHGTDLAALARAHGLDVESVATTQQLKAALAKSGPRVIVVRTNRDHNVQRHDEVHAAVARALTIA